MRYNIGLKLIIRVFVFLLIMMVWHLLMLSIRNRIFTFVSLTAVLTMGYFIIIKPIILIENSVNNILKGSFPRKKELKYLGATGENFNLLLDHLMILRESLNILFAASKTITSRVEIDDVINMVLDLVYEKMHLPAVFVSFPTERGFLKIKASRGVSEETVRDSELPNNESFLGRAFLTKETIVVNDAVKKKLPSTGKVMDKEGIKSFIHIPIIVGDKSAGVFTVVSGYKKFFSKDMVKTLTAFADYLAVAIGNSQFYQDMQRFNRRLEQEVESTTEELTNTNLRLISKVKEMKALNDIIFAASSKVDMDEMLLTIIEKIKVITNVSTAGFMIYDKETNMLIGCGDIKGFNLNVLKEEDVLIKSFKNASAFISNELFIESAGDLQKLYKDYRITSLVALPLIEEKVSGLFVLGNKIIGKFLQDDMRFLSVLTSQVAELISRTKLYGQLANRVNDLVVLRDISNTITTAPKLEEIIEVVAEKLVRATGSDYIIFWFLNDSEEKLVPLFPPEYVNQDMKFDIKDSEGIIKYFIEGKARVLKNDEFDNRFDKLKEKYNFESYLFVPLRVEEKKIGFFCLYSKKQNLFNDEKIRFTELVANHSAVIVENARIYGQLKRINVELDRLNKVKDDFVSMVSHELRTPLTAIKGFVHVVLEEEVGRINEQQKKFLGIAKQSINHLNMLISDLLDLSKIESGLITIKMEKVNLSDIVKKSIETSMGQIREKNIEIKVDIDKDALPVEGDSSRLLQVFNNLIFNAIKFSKKDGHIKIVVKDKGNYIFSAITDSGVGIPKEEHKKIFEKFYQVDSSYARTAGGTGLGLYIVKTIIKLHGGKIWLESEIGKGSTFSFLLPKAKKKIVKKTTSINKKLVKTDKSA
ncbi:MAG: GAF domain-containing protein [Elusimicrobia bacterium]|nr:GAF domain-containing protein [Elusimicrobiota bacterium]